MYRPPSAGCAYYENILNQIEKVHSSNNKVVLLGDLNFDYLSDNDLVSGPLHNIETIYDMKQIVVSPTRVTTSSSSLLDVILTTCPDDHVRTEVIDLSLSDHSLVSTEVKTEMKPKSSHKTVTFRNFRHFNETVFLEDLKKCSAVINCDFDVVDLAEKWDAFKNAFVSICNNHAPMCTRRMKDRHNPWIDASIVNLMYERDFVKRQAVRNKDELLFRKYQELRNEVTSKICAAKKAYYEKELTTNAGKPGRIWKIIGKIVNGNRHSDLPDDISADGFNEFFATIGEKVAMQSNRGNHDIPWKGPVSDVDFKFTKVKCADVEKRLRKLGMSSNIDVLGIDSKLLCITALINAAIMSHTVPHDWKFAKVSPVFKGKGCKCQMKNYRPISVISHVAKVFEQEVQVQ
jgi:hypothetical protein